MSLVASLTEGLTAPLVASFGVSDPILNTPDLAFYFSAENSSITGTEANITGISDLSGNGVDLVVPEFQTGTLSRGLVDGYTAFDNSLALEFQGNVSGLSGGSNATIFIVHRPLLFSSTRPIIDFSTNNANVGGIAFTPVTPSARIGTSPFATVAGVGVPEAIELLTVSYSGSSYVIRQNGVEVANTTGGTISFQTGITVFKFGSLGGSTYLGALYQLATYSRVLNGAELDKIEQSFISKYSL